MGYANRIVFWMAAKPNPIETNVVIRNHWQVLAKAASQMHAGVSQRQNEPVEVRANPLKNSCWNGERPVPVMRISHKSEILHGGQMKIVSSRRPYSLFSKTTMCCCGRVSTVRRRVSPTAFISFSSCVTD